MKRRGLLLAGSSCLGATLSGCLDRAGESAASGTSSRTRSDTATPTATPEPVYDCDEVARPTAPSQSTNPPGDDDRYSYPPQPTSLSDESTVLAYVEAFERAYRLNDLRAQFGESLTQASVYIERTWSYDAPEETTIARMMCSFNYTFDDDGSQIAGQSASIFVSYYVDDSVVLRVVEEEPPEDESELGSDPRQHGAPVECF